MKALYFCSWDGDLKLVFKSEEKAYAWEAENGNLAFVYEVIYDDDNKIIAVSGQDFIDWIESVSDVGDMEFSRVKSAIEREWAFTDVTDD